MSGETLRTVSAEGLEPKTNFHDRYGKDVVKKAAGNYFASTGPSIPVRYGRKKVQIDAIVNPSVAVEVEAKTNSKQVRGAVLDLICHPYPKKLLVLIPLEKAEEIAEQSRSILEKFVKPSDFRVVVLKGTGTHQHLETDGLMVKDALHELGWTVPLKAQAASNPPTK